LTSLDDLVLGVFVLSMGMFMLFTMGYAVSGAWTRFLSDHSCY